MDLSASPYIKYIVFGIVLVVSIGIIAGVSPKLNSNPANLDSGTLAAIGLAVCLFVISCIITFYYFFPNATETLTSVLGSISTNTKPLSGSFWFYSIPALLIVLIIIYTTIAIVMNNNTKSTPRNIQTVIDVQQHTYTVAAQSSEISTPVRAIAAYGSQYLPDTKNYLINWRPMTVRLAGYLNNNTSGNTKDGVFDLKDSSSAVGNTSISVALKLGARAFVFDIDYLLDYPCDPVIINRDDSGVMRSLNTGSIVGACKSLAKNAFTTNQDPVIIILYIRRLPNSPFQKTNFLKSIANALKPLAPNHLGSTDIGNFHSCLLESALFMNQISKYQRKFIVLTNYDTSLITPSKDPRDNLHFWTNARIWQDPTSIGGVLGTVTGSPPNKESTIIYAQVGAFSQYLNPTNAAKYDKDNYNKFTIALSSVQDSPSYADIDKVMNTLGVQCVPLNVLALATSDAHKAVVSYARNKPLDKFDTLPVNTTDPLAFWQYSGWSFKPSNLTIYVAPSPVIPTTPSPAMNSNGGLANIK